MSGPRPNRLWPMKWVIVAILIFIVGYTWVMVRFRKPGPAFRPYQDSVDRTTVSRLLNSGYQRISMTAEHPADPIPALVLNGGAAAEVRGGPGGIPEDLSQMFVEKPVLMDSIDRLTAPRETSADLPLRLLIAVTQSDNRQVISGASLFRRGNDLVVLPLFEPIGGGLQARWKESNVVLGVPAGALPPGRYEVDLISRKNSKHWTVVIRP